MPAIPSSFLGSWEASPWEVATAYTIFPNEGIRYRPYLISEIKDREGKILYTTPQLSYPAAKGSSAASVSRILEEVATHGTAVSVTRLGFDKPCAGKTGTTDDFKDAWFSGYTSNLTCAVWVGFDTPRKIVQGGYGAALSLPVWVDIMKTANRLGYKAGKLNHKADLIDISLCRLSGKRTTEACIAAGTSYVDGVPADIILSENDLCPLHPARAQLVEDPTSPSASPSSPPPRALSVEEAPLRAIPVE
jgi:penicillin-binding protein 1A